MELPWQPRFDFYFARVDDHPASFMLDLNADRLDSHPLRVHVRVPLQKPRPDGLRDRDELEAMGRIEDQMVAQMADQLEAVYVGRMVHRGATEFFFYLPTASEPALAELGEVLGDIAPYEAQYQAAPDPTWQLYHDFLYPDAYAHAAMSNRRLLAQLEQMGDRLTKPRAIDHFAYFAARADAEAAASALRGANFAVGEIEAREASFALPFVREDALADGRADAVSSEILDLILPHGGSYDGWGCELASGDSA